MLSFVPQPSQPNQPQTSPIGAEIRRVREARGETLQSFAAILAANRGNDDSARAHHPREESADMDEQV